jgi:predicted phosphatase
MIGIIIVSAALLSIFLINRKNKKYNILFILNLEYIFHYLIL